MCVYRYIDLILYVFNMGFCDEYFSFLLFIHMHHTDLCISFSFILSLFFIVCYFDCPLNYNVVTYKYMELCMCTE